MKILSLLSEPLNYPDLTALPRCVYEIAKRLKVNNDVLILTSGDIDRNYDIDGLRVYEFKGKNLAFFSRAAEFIKDTDVDVIHFYGSLLGSNLLMFNFKEISKPIVLNIYTRKAKLLEFKNLKLSDLTSDFSHIFKQPYFLSSLIPSLLLRKGLNNNNVKKIITPSLRLKDNLRLLTNSDKIIQIPHGVDFHRFDDCSQQRVDDLRKKLGFKQDDKVVLYFGRSAMVRGIDVLIKALGIAQKTIEIKACFLLMPSKNVARIKKAAYKVMAKNSAWINAGFVKNIEDYISMADIIALPYRFCGDLPEYPFALLESMAAGKLIVTTGIGAMTELIKDGKNGYIVTPKDDKQLAEALIKLSILDDGSVARSQMAKKVVENFDWDNVSKHILEVYSKIKKQNNLVASFFNNLSNRYDDVAFYKSAGLEYLSQIEEKFLSDNISAHQGDKLLCVGIGTGRDAGLFTKKGVIIDGIDISEGMMSKAKQKLNGRNVRFTVADAGKHLPFESHIFDYVICTRVLKYINTWEHTIKEIARVQKKNGTFVLELANLYSIQFLGLRKAVYHLFKLRDVKKILETNGYEITKIAGGSRLPYPLYIRINNKFVLKIVKSFEGFLKIILPNIFLSRNLLLVCRYVNSNDKD